MNGITLTPAKGQRQVVITSKRKFDPTRTLVLLENMATRANKDNAVLAQTAMLTALQAVTLRINEALSIHPDGDKREGMELCLTMIESLYRELEHG